MEEVTTAVPQMKTLKAHEGRGKGQKISLHQIGKMREQGIYNFGGSCEPSDIFLY